MAAALSPPPCPVFVVGTGQGGRWFNPFSVPQPGNPDLLGKILSTGVNHLVRRGIDRGYVERREDLAGIRGKLAVSDTAKRALRSRARAACDFEELSVDIPGSGSPLRLFFGSAPTADT